MELRRYWSSSELPTIPPPHPVVQSAAPPLSIGPVHELIPMNNCCHPLRLKITLAPAANLEEATQLQRSSFVTGIEL